LQNDRSLKKQSTLLAEITDYEHIPVVIRRFLEMGTSKEVNVGETVVVSEKNPMIVLKNQGDVRERMDPSLWNPNYLAIIMNLPQDANLYQRFERYIISIVQGDVPRKNKGERFVSQNEGVMFLEVSNIIFTGIDTASTKFVMQKQYERLTRVQPYVNDILLVRSGATIGKIAVVTTDIGRCIVNGHIDVIRVKEINPIYLTLYLKTKFGQIQFDRYRSGVAQPELGYDDIYRILIYPIFQGLQERLEKEYLKMSQFHNTAIGAKKKGDDIAYRNNISIAEGMLNNLVQQLEEIIEGKREEIEPVDI